MVFLIAVAAFLTPILLGGFLAWGASRFDHVVVKTKEEIDSKDKGYNAAFTFGHKIKVEADKETQLKEARLLAAKNAAALPRGANMRIGRLGHVNLRTAGQVEALENDPMSATKIALYHGWDGARAGAVAVAVTPAVAAPGAAVAPGGKIELVPGKDYEYIEITDDMSPDEKRKARIANSKAKSAAMKAAKAAATGAPAVPAAAPAAAPTAPAAQPAAATAVSIEPPQIVEITDDMSPDEVRKARIANSKAKSAFNKALKAAGIDPKTVKIEDGKVVLPAGAGAPAAAPAAAVEQPAAAPAAPAATVAPAAAPPAATPAAAAADIPQPDYIEITDDMPPDEVRKARIHNAKAKSAYNKALKAAGIDPKSVS